MKFIGHKNCPNCGKDFFLSEKVKNVLPGRTLVCSACGLTFISNKVRHWLATATAIIIIILPTILQFILDFLAPGELHYAKYIAAIIIFYFISGNERSKNA